MKRLPILGSTGSIGTSTLEAYLGGRCSFGRIAATIDAVMNSRSNRNRPLVSIDRTIQADVRTLRIAMERPGNTTTPSRVSTS